MFTGNKIDNKIKLLFLFWIIFSILPSSITTEAPHAMRIFTVLPTPQIIESFGIVYFLLIIQKFSSKLFKIITYSMVFGSLFFIVEFYHSYFIDFSKQLSSQFQYGVVNALSYAIKNQNKYEKVVVSNKADLFQSYMFYLYQSKFDPYFYQKLGGTRSGGFAASHLIGKFYFTDPLTFKLDKKPTLFVLNHAEIERTIYNFRFIKSFNFLNGQEAIVLFDNL